MNVHPKCFKQVCAVFLASAFLLELFNLSKADDAAAKVAHLGVDTEKENPNLLQEDTAGKAAAVREGADAAPQAAAHLERSSDDDSADEAAPSQGRFKRSFFAAAKAEAAKAEAAKAALQAQQDQIVAMPISKQDHSRFQMDEQSKGYYEPGYPGYVEQANCGPTFCLSAFDGFFDTCCFSGPDNGECCTFYSDECTVNFGLCCNGECCGYGVGDPLCCPQYTYCCYNYLDLTEHFTCCDQNTDCCINQDGKPCCCDSSSECCVTGEGDQICCPQGDICFTNSVGPICCKPDQALCGDECCDPSLCCVYGSSSQCCPLAGCCNLGTCSAGPCSGGPPGKRSARTFDESVASSRNSTAELEIWRQKQDQTQARLRAQKARASRSSAANRTEAVSKRGEREEGGFFGRRRSRKKQDFLMEPVQSRRLNRA